MTKGSPFSFATRSTWPVSRKADLCRAMRDEVPTPDTRHFSVDELAGMMVRFVLFGEQGLKATQQPVLPNY